MRLYSEYFNTTWRSQNITACFCITLEFSLSCSTQAWCFSVGFDIEKAVQCFDSFQAMMERKKMGGGVGGVVEKESWAAQCHTREDCRENKRTGEG